jgi:transposase
MRFVALKTEEQQARSMIFRTRDLLVRQRTQLVNALRGGPRFAASVGLSTFCPVSPMLSEFASARSTT